MFNAWNRDDTASLVWLENDGQQQFTHQQIASSPTHLVTVATGDINGDGLGDILTSAEAEDSGGSAAGATYVLLSPNVCE